MRNVRYNAVSLIKAALRSHHGRTQVKDEVSGYYLSLEISRTYDGMMIAIPALHWALLRDLSDQEFHQRRLRIDHDKTHIPHPFPPF